jgi:predicted transcriptional regulator of viral defense system
VSYFPHRKPDPESQASKLYEKLPWPPGEITSKSLAKILNWTPERLRLRAHELVEQGRARRVRRGVYQRREVVSQRGGAS